MNDTESSIIDLWKSCFQRSKPADYSAVTEMLERHKASGYAPSQELLLQMNTIPNPIDFIGLMEKTFPRCFEATLTESIGNPLVRIAREGNTALLLLFNDHGYNIAALADQPHHNKKTPRDFAKSFSHVDFLDLLEAIINAREEQALAIEAARASQKDFIAQELELSLSLKNLAQANESYTSRPSQESLTAIEAALTSAWHIYSHIKRESREAVYEHLDHFLSYVTFTHQPSESFLRQHLGSHPIPFIDLMERHFPGCFKPLVLDPDCSPFFSIASQCSLELLNLFMAHEYDIVAAMSIKKMNGLSPLSVAHTKFEEDPIDHRQFWETLQKCMHSVEADVDADAWNLDHTSLAPGTERLSEDDPFLMKGLLDTLDDIAASTVGPDIDTLAARMDTTTIDSDSDDEAVETSKKPRQEAAAARSTSTAFAADSEQGCSFSPAVTSARHFDDNELPASGHPAPQINMVTQAGAGAPITAEQVREWRRQATTAPFVFSASSSSFKRVAQSGASFKRPRDSEPPAPPSP